MVKKNKEIKLSFILPIFNEEVNIKVFIKEFFRIFPEKTSCELIVVNDCSTDRSLEILEELKKEYSFHLINNSLRQGRGRSFRTGLKICRGKFTGYMDSDMQIHPENIRRGLNILKDGVEIVCGRRVEKGTSFIRRFLSSSFRITAFFITGLPCSDPLCGFKLFNVNTLSRIIDKTKDEHWFFDFEIMYYAKKNGIKIQDLPVIFEKAHAFHVSKTSLIRDSLMYLKKLFQLKFL